MHIARPSSSSKMDTAIQLLQHLAAAAAQDGEACADVLFQAADFLQDTLDVSDELDEPRMGGAGLAAFETLMNNLASVLPDGDQVPHAA